MTINNQQDRIICRRLNKLNKMIEPFSKYIGLNPSTCMASRNSARQCSNHKFLLHIFLGNTINCGTYVAVAFLQATTLPMLERPLLSCPHADNFTLPVLQSCYPCFIKTEYPVDWMINCSQFRFIDVKIACYVF